MRKIISALFGWAYIGTGSGQTVEAQAVKVEANFSELFQDVLVCDLAANATAYSPKRAPQTARTLAGIELRVQATLATGTFVVTVEDADGNNLLSTTIDGTTLTTSFVAKTLTATTANLAIAAGEPVRVKLVSNNGSATGGPVVARLTWAGA